MEILRRTRYMAALLFTLVPCLFFATRATGASAPWKIETLDGGGPGQYTSMKIDTNGNVHLVYVIDDGRTLPLRYAFWDRRVKQWFKMTIAEHASFCSLALDSKQRPHVSYADPGTMSGAKLRYAYWDGKAWIKQAIPLLSEIIGYYTSIALDANDRPTISFYEYRGPVGSDLKIRLRHATWTGKYWQVRTVDAQEGSGKFNSLAIAKEGVMHLAYANVSAMTASMRYAYWDGNSWRTELLEEGGRAGYNVAITLDHNSTPHVTYITGVDGLFVKYAVRHNGRWKIEAVEALAGAAYPDRNSITVDAKGRPYLSYYDSGRGILRVAHWNGSAWMAETVDENACGFTSSLQLDRGMLWVSYTDLGNRAIKVAHRVLTETESGVSEDLASTHD